jgi:hypothetical protein
LRDFCFATTLNWCPRRVERPNHAIRDTSVLERVPRHVIGNLPVRSGGGFPPVIVDTGPSTPNIKKSIMGRAAHHGRRAVNRCRSVLSESFVAVYGVRVLRIVCRMAGEVVHFNSMEPKDHVTLPEGIRRRTRDWRAPSFLHSGMALLDEIIGKSLFRLYFIHPLKSFQAARTFVYASLDDIQNVRQDSKVKFVSPPTPNSPNNLVPYVVAYASRYDPQTPGALYRGTFLARCIAVAGVLSEAQHASSRQ